MKNSIEGKLTVQEIRKLDECIRHILALDPDITVCDFIGEMEHLFPMLTPGEICQRTLAL